jgi:hypothetical protein
MTKQGKRELLKAIRPRYLKASKVEKSRILNEFVASTRYNRKYAIHLLRNGPPRRSKNKKRGRRLVYGPDVIAALAHIWEVSGHLCAKRLHPFLPQMVEALERHNEIRMAPETRKKLLQMSISTIDRRLKRARGKLAGRGRTTTKPGTLLKNAIPIRTFADWDEQTPGFVEMDLVAHCGESTAGEFLHTLNVVDIETRWTETIALPNKGQKATFEGIQTMRHRLPFPLLGIDSDSGGEFINHHLYNYCQDEKITFTRARPYKKNDQAHIEQRNWTVVRQVVGYARYDSPEALILLNIIYEDLRLFVNFFQPVMKLESKTRVGSKVRKKYDEAQTPCQRVLASSDIDQAVKHQLQEVYLALNPAELRRRIEANLTKLWRLRQ